MSVGEKLRSLRIKAKKTLKEQSKIFNVSLNYIYRWEHDLAIPKNAVLNKIAEFYDVPLSWLVGENDENSDIEQIVNSGIEQQLLRMFRKLPENKKQKILGYIECMYVEELNRCLP